MNELNFVLEASDRAALVGRNGVGKTTLVRLLAGDLEPSMGEVQATGLIGFVPQRLPEPDRNQTVAGFLGVAAECIEKRLERRLQLLGIGHISHDRHLNTLSGGELRRLFLAKVHECDFVILDEPTNDLDAEAREALRHWLKVRRGGWLVVSHDRDLLALANGFAELTEQGIHTCAGNYAHFLEYRERTAETLAATIAEQERSLRLGEKTKEVALRRQHKRTQKAAAEVKVLMHS